MQAFVALIGPFLVAVQCKVRLQTYHKNVDNVVGYYKKIMVEVREVSSSPFSLSLNTCSEPKSLA